MTAVKRFFGAHRVFFALFGFLLAYELLIGNHLAPWRVNEHFFVFFTVDYSLGFCSKLLPGAVFRWIFKGSDPAAATVCSVILIALILAGVCLLLEKLLKKTARENRFACLGVILLLITGPASFSLFVTWLGVIDVYWIVSCMAFFILLSRKQLYFLIPPVLVSCVFVHYGAMLCYVPMMLVMLLVKTVFTEEKGERKLLWAVFWVGAAAAAGSTLYFMLFEQKNLTYPVEEFDRIVQERGAKYTYYFDYNFYKTALGADGASFNDYINAASSLPGRLVRTVISQVRVTLALRMRSESLRDFAVALAVLLPAAVALIAVLLRCARDKTLPVLRRLVYVLPPLLFIGTFTLSILFSSDEFRWLTHSFLPLCASFLFLAYYDGERLWTAARRYMPSAPVFAAYYILYAALAFAG